MKKFKCKEYIRIPEKINNSCIGCIAYENSNLCKAIRDEDYCTNNGGMIYKEKSDGWFNAVYE